MSNFGKDGFGKEWSKDRENVASISAGLREFREGRDSRDGRMKQVMPPSFDVDSENNFFDTEGDMELDTVDGNPTEKHVDADFYNSEQTLMSRRSRMSALSARQSVNSRMILMTPMSLDVLNNGLVGYGGYARFNI